MTSTSSFAKTVHSPDGAHELFCSISFRRFRSPPDPIFMQAASSGFRSGKSFRHFYQGFTCSEIAEAEGAAHRYDPMAHSCRAEKVKKVEGQKRFFKHFAALERG